MGDIYRSPKAVRELRAWCEERLEGRDRSTVPTALGETALVTVGDGRATVLHLPGTNFNGATSLTLLDAIAAAGWRAVCADLPGQPGLSATERPDDEGRYAEWVGQVLRHLRRQHGGPLLLSGHSRGAAVALSAAPELVDGLVLESPAGLVGVRPTWPVLRATVSWMFLRRTSGAASLARLMAGPEPGHSDELVAWLALVARSVHTTGAPGRLPVDVLHRWRGRPVAVLVGEHDCFFPPAVIAAAARADLGVEARVVPRAGHLLVDQTPETVVTALREFAAP